MIKAKCIKNVNPCPNEKCEELTVGQLYEVSDISMGSMYTHIYLKDFDKAYNSIMFEFYENGKQIDIYRERRFNPYL